MALGKISSRNNMKLKFFFIVFVLYIVQNANSSHQFNIATDCGAAFPDQQDAVEGDICGGGDLALDITGSEIQCL